MPAVSHGVRQLRQGIGLSWKSAPAPGHTSRSIHIPAFAPRPSQPPPPSIAQRVFSETRTLFTRIVAHLTTPGLSASPVPVPPHPSLLRPTHFTNSQSISARFSLPVKHALSRPFSAPHLPRPCVVPANVTHVGLGTARGFHSGRPIFQNMVDNVPIATRALWEAEWDVKLKKKETCRIRRASQNKAVPKSQEMLKPKSQPLMPEPQSGASELDVYFPVESTPAVTTHLLVPLAPTPTTRLPLSTRTDDGDAHPLLPVSNLASIHTRHRLHSLRVSTLFARLDAVNVWDDPGVNVDAYAFGPRYDAQERQCTVLRVTFRGWNMGRVRTILGDGVEEWYSLEETHTDGRPTSVPVLDFSQDMNAISPRSESTSLDSTEIGSACVSELEINNEHDLISPLPTRASASAQHDLVLPMLNLSPISSDAPANLTPPPQPVILLRTVSDLTCDVGLISSPPMLSSSTNLPPLEGSWECVGLSSSFLQRVDEHCQDEVSKDM